MRVSRKSRLAAAVAGVLCALGPMRQARAATAPIPAVSGPSAGPGLMYPNPPVSIVAGAVRVEDFPYVTEEYLVSGTANGSPYTTRIIIRRPASASTFSGVVVAEALHAGGRSLIFEWSRTRQKTSSQSSTLRPWMR